jgi:glutathione S-transferase
MPKVAKNLLRERSVEFFCRARSKDVGMSLEEYADRGSDRCWDDAFKKIDALAAFVSEMGGPFVEGNEVSYTDFRIVSTLFFFKRVDGGDFHKLMDHPKALPLLHHFEACDQWFQKDD